MPDTFWKVAVCVKNGKSEKEICDYLDLSITTVRDRHLKDLHGHFGTKDLHSLQQKLSNLHRLEPDDLKHLSIAKCFDQVKNNLHLPPDELLKTINSYLGSLAPMNNRLKSYADGKPWLRNLRKHHPDLNQLQLLTCIGIRNGLTSNSIGELTGQTEKQIERIRASLRELFGQTDNDDFISFIENYPNEP